MAQKPKLLQRKSVADRVIDRISGFVETFFSGMRGYLTSCFQKGIITKIIKGLENKIKVQR